MPATYLGALPDHGRFAYSALPARTRAGHAGGLVAAMVAVPGVLAAAVVLRWFMPG